MKIKWSALLHRATIISDSYVRNNSTVSYNLQAKYQWFQKSANTDIQNFHYSYQ